MEADEKPEDEPKRWKIEMSGEAQAFLDSLPEEDRQKMYDFLFDKLAVDPEGVGTIIGDGPMYEVVIETEDNDGD
jgi:hypothetical protein